MRPGAGGKNAAARRALNKSALKQEWLDNVFDGIARFGERGGNGFNADRSAAKMLRNQTKIAPVKRVEPEGVNLKALQRFVGNSRVYLSGALNGRHIAHPPQQSPGGRGSCPPSCGDSRRSL